MTAEQRHRTCCGSFFLNFEQIPNTALYTYKSDTSDIVLVFIANFELIQYINLTLLNFQHPIT